MVPARTVLSFYRRNNSELIAIATYICKQYRCPVSPADVIQDIYFKLLTTNILKDYDPDKVNQAGKTTKLSTYIYLIVKNHVLCLINACEYRILKCEIPENIGFAEDDIDHTLAYYAIATDYQTLLERNRISDASDNLGFDIRSFIHHFYSSRANRKFKKFSLIDIFLDIYHGYSNREIAAKYGVSEMTTIILKNRIAKAMQKYGFEMKRKSRITK